MSDSVIEGCTFVLEEKVGKFLPPTRYQVDWQTTFPLSRRYQILIFLPWLQDLDIRKDMHLDSQFVPHIYIIIITLVLVILMRRSKNFVTRVQDSVVEHPASFHTS